MMHVSLTILDLAGCPGTQAGRAQQERASR